MISTPHEIFYISTVTPFTKDQIETFILLTGISVWDTRKILVQYSEAGISNLRDVFVLIKLGVNVNV